jgi:hypothetical protein
MLQWEKRQADDVSASSKSYKKKQGGHKALSIDWEGTTYLFGGVLFAWMRRSAVVFLSAPVHCLVPDIADRDAACELSSL